MTLLDHTQPEHQKVVLPFYYAHYRGDEMVKELAKLGYKTDTDVLRLLQNRFKAAGIPRFNRERILAIAHKELNDILGINTPLP